MNKKITILVTVLLLFGVLLSGCRKQYTPRPEVEQYLNSGLTAEKSFEKIAECNYTSTVTIQNKNGSEQGKQTNKVSFNVTDKENLLLVMEQTFSGSYVENGVTEQFVTLSKQDGKYIYAVETNVSSQNKIRQVDDEFAQDLITALVYTDNGAYDNGGLYYGDTFMLSIYKYPPESFCLDTESDLCVFDEKMLIIHDRIGKVRLYQTTKINRLGLLEYDYEKYVGEDSDQIVISEVIARYKYVN